MKKIICITTALIFSIMLFSNLSYSYEIYIIKPKPCPDFPSFLHHPAFTQQCEFIITSQGKESDTILYKIFIEQNGNQLQLDEGYCLSGETVYRTVNLQNFIQLCFNEVAAIRIDARPWNGGAVTNSERGYLIVYKNELSCSYSSITGGTVQLLTPGFIPVTFYSRCGSLASSTYFTKRYKITFTLYGNFRDSTPEIVNSLCLGYSGAGPNNQEFWAAKIESSDSHAKFITFVNECYNVLGQYMGFWPGRPEDATVVFKYAKKPIITNVTLYPSSINITNSTCIATCNLAQGFENIQYDWRDSNATEYPIEFIRIQPDKVKVIGDFRGRKLSEREEDRSYCLFVRAYNNYGSTGWVKRKVRVGSNLVTCPLIEYDVEDFKVFENSSIVGSNGEMKNDHYLHTNPDLSGKKNITFNIKESGKDVTYLDQVTLTQVKVNKGEYVAVDDSGDVINYKIDSEIPKVMLNDDTDASDAAAFNDGEDIKLAKGDKLNVSLKADGGGYILLNSHIPTNKEAMAGVITTNNGNQYQFYSRDNQNYSCIKLKENSITEFDFEAFQSLVIEQILFAKDLKTNERKELPLRSVIHNKYGNVTDLLSEADGSLAEISGDMYATFDFENEISPDKTSYYIQNTYGKVIKSGSDNVVNKSEEVNFRLENKLFENVPNPFNPVTHIEFEIPDDAFVSLKVYDVSGRVVNTIINEFRKAGRHNVSFDGSNYASGIYFYAMECGSFRETKRMVLLK